MEKSAKPAARSKAKLLLLKDYQPLASSNSQLDDLRCQLLALPEFEQVELVPKGTSMVEAFVPAQNRRQVDRLKSIASLNLKGWRVVEEQSYKLPMTF